MTGTYANEAYWTEKLCGGLEYGIEGGIHVVQLLWHQHDKEEYWGFLLIGARNALNEEKRTAILWEVRHNWPSGAQFAFN